MGDVTFTDCTVGGFAGPGGSIGTTSAISQLQPPSGSECMSYNIVKNYSTRILTLHTNGRNTIVIAKKVIWRKYVNQY